MEEIHVLNLGAGQQSTALYLMSRNGAEPDFIPHFDYAVIADTGNEPAPVYHHLEWLKSLGSPPIHSVRFGDLDQDMIEGHHKVVRGDDCKYRAGEVIDQCYKSPLFCRKSETGRGRLPRECTAAYKIAMVEQFIRTEILGVPPGRPVPPTAPIVHQYFGISIDEPSRAAKIRMRFAGVTWAIPHFPLLEMEMTRADCVAYARDLVPHEIPRSLCWHCPFRTNEMWRHLRDTSPEDFERACRFDERIREPGAAVAEDCEYPLYLHRSCIPLRLVDIDASESAAEAHLHGVAQECDGVCGM